MLRKVDDNNSNSNSNSNSKGIDLICPPPRLCTDNGVMAAWSGIEKLCRGISDAIEPIVENASVQDVNPRWPLGSPFEGGVVITSQRQKILQRKIEAKLIASSKQPISD